MPTDKSSAKHKRFVIRVPQLTSYPLQLIVPEFTGKVGDKSFAVRQSLHWDHTTQGDGSRRFALEGVPHEVGYDFHGKVSLAGQDALSLDISMNNLHKKELVGGHHTFLLKINPKSEFIDINGENTLLYTDSGWLSLSQMVRQSGRGHVRETFRQGANYGGHTLIWKIIVRMDREKRNMIALALNRGYAFASDHPEWDPGLLVGCRWGMLYPNEPEKTYGRIYLMNHNSLAELEQRYAEDMK